MNAKKTLSMTLAAAMAAGLLAGCGGSSSTAASSTSTSTESKAESTAASSEATTDAAGKVYYLNFKPEQDEAWQNLAKKYTEETGVPVTVVTAASGQYETTLMSEMAKSDAPTLFQVNGPVGLANWKDYCYDLSGTKIAGDLTSDTYALKDGDQTLGIGYVIESYGLITNKTLLEKAGYSTDDITNFDSLKSVAEDITARKDELGFAAFTSAGINQPKHQIILTVDVSVSVLLPGFRTATKVSNSFIVAETVIVGTVPATYTYFSTDPDSYEEDLKDYILNNS